ncbi:MAG: hypothetical protein M0P31_12370 [Solirubrobacteraceae bacterium]|nr:hypothetical protein [Solirubrobacteraceae bacterium]
MSAPSVPNPVVTSMTVHVEALLNCALREADAVVVGGADGASTAELPVLGGAATIEAELTYASPTGRHRYRLPARLRTVDGRVRPLELDGLAALLVDALSAHGTDDPTALAAPPAGGAPARLSVLQRIGLSVDALAGFLAADAAGPEPLQAGPYPGGRWTFAATERSLVTGHPFHPTPKCRGEMRPDERDRYAPETASRFALRWLAVDPAIVRHDSAVVDDDGAEVPAPRLAADLLETALATAADGPAGDAHDGAEPAAGRAARTAALRDRLAGLGDRVIVPMHPWEVERLRGRDDVAGLLRSGAIVDLGAHGAPVAATTSVRTVHHEAWPWQLKFSLHLRVTNSMRLNLPKELDRSVEAARLARTVVGERMAAVAPHWVVVHDPAHLAVLDADGAVIDGLSVLLRENRWRGGGLDATAVTSLCQDHPYDGRSRLARIVDRLAAEAGERPDLVARRWFARYLDVFVASVLRIYLDVGLTFEPHQQNLMLELEDGWPARAVHRDSQGYFHREAAHEDLCRIVPGLGEATESIFPEPLADERLVYYPFVNNAMGVVGAMGAAGLVDERILLADLRAAIERERERGGRYPHTLLDRLLDDERWPCKANLRTRIGDLDELVGDIAEQSVYVTIPNPLVAHAPARTSA